MILVILCLQFFVTQTNMDLFRKHSSLPIHLSHISVDLLNIPYFVQSLQTYFNILMMSSNPDKKVFL